MKTYRSDDILKIFDVNYLSSIAVKKVTIGQAANGVTPTIASVSTKLNSEICCTVIKTWILSINAYVGKECFSAYQAHELSAIIATEAYYLTLAELAIFFNWVKAGKCGQIYGQLDPVFITSALQQFLITRRDEIHRYERDIDREKREEAQLATDIVREGYSQLSESHGNKSAWEIYQSLKPKPESDE